MGVLFSSVFAGENVDDQTSQRLEDCAQGRPNQVVSHIAMGAKGEHVRRLQEALRRIVAGDVELRNRMFDQGIDLRVNGIYDVFFADAVGVYKKHRNILNDRNQIDSIVGVKTILRMDEDLRGPKKQSPQPDRPNKPNDFPKLDGPSCLKDENCPASSQFSIEMGVTKRDLADRGIFVFRIRDATNKLVALYLLMALQPDGPVTVSEFGPPTSFKTRQPVRVTRFGPTARLLVLGEVSGSLLFESRPDGSGPSTESAFVQSKSALGTRLEVFGNLTLLSRCLNDPGATLF